MFIDGVFRPADFLELPTSKLVTAWPDWTLSAVQDDLAFARLAEQFSGGMPSPLYRLEKDLTQDSPLILFGMNSISYNSPGLSYPGWAKYRTDALAVLQKASAIFGQGELLKPLSFRYVDVFEAADFDGLARKMSTTGISDRAQFGQSDRSFRADVWGIFLSLSLNVEFGQSDHFFAASPGCFDGGLRYE